MNKVLYNKRITESKNPHYSDYPEKQRNYLKKNNRLISSE